MRRVRAAVLERVDAPRPFATSRPVVVADLELSDPGPGEVLVRVEAAGVCHSDLSRLTGVRAVAVPLVLGHEGCGIVEVVGEGVTRVAVGDRVTATFMPRCGACAACTGRRWRLCERGLVANAAGTLLSGERRFRRDGVAVDHHSGVSAFAERIVTSEHSLVRIPDAVPADVGALLGCAVLTGGGAVSNAGRLERGESVAIVGLGGVGMAAALMAEALGAGSITAIDANVTRLDVATAMGATEALTPDEAVARGARFDLVVECVGNAAALSTAVAATDVGGRTVAVGLPRPGTRVSVDTLALVTEARTLVGSYMGSGDPDADIARAAAMVLDGALRVDSLITGHVALDDLPEAMDRLDRGEAIRQIVRFPEL